ncbi:U-box domain-containing protein 5 isoform X1 [Amaranthus tricolor]|uniref:U-box domain-containing protein 5 isoform X1 n=1 Tax=Amaranthus tricolor TaxID=29722 RepID=UPI0025855FBF|nr:U-box domain-containing protein 5 isoform X1 [Amaranthus tricolor]
MLVTENIKSEKQKLMVHLSMCKLLLGLVDRISKIVPDIEAARPRAQGINALSELHLAIDKAKALVQNCRSSSKLYLAITGETVKSRFEKTKNCLDHNLSLLQNMVPVALGTKISEILNDVRALKFFLDSREELAGKALRAILQQDEYLLNSDGNSEIDLIQFAASKLDLKSAKDLLIEARCLRKLLNDVKDGMSTKRKTLKYLCYLLKKHDKLILQGKTRTSSIQLDEAFSSVESDSKTKTTKSSAQVCRFGHEVSMYGSLDTSLNSIRSTASSMKDIDIRIDMSSLSLGSLDSSYSISHTKPENSFACIEESSEIESPRFQFYSSIDDIRTQFLSNIRGHSWKLQCTAIQDVQTYLINHNPSCAFVSSENFLDPLMSFLQDAVDKHDREALKVGSQLFLTFLQADRWDPIHLSEDVYTFLASVLATEPAAEALAIMEVLSFRVPFSKFAASDAFCASIVNILKSHARDFLEPALQVLYNFSSSIDNASCNVASDWILVLVHFLEDSTLAGTCLGILENLCKFEETKRSIAETQGCIASIVKLLENENCSSRDQEYAVGILLSLCSQSDYYCYLVLSEGCIPSVVNVSHVGSDKGKFIATELLRQLKEFNSQEIEQESTRSNAEQELPRSNAGVFDGRVGRSKQKSSKTSGFFSKLFRKR